MAAIEKLLRDIHALRELIQIDWEELAANPLRDQERRDLYKHIKACQAELAVLLERLSNLDESSSD